MFDEFNLETFWLNATNAVLGIVTLVCVAIVGRATFQEIRARLANRSRVPIETDSHAFNLADLGITMADGGELLGESKQSPRSDKKETSDPDNIIRSEN